MKRKNISQRVIIAGAKTVFYLSIVFCLVAMSLSCGKAQNSNGDKFLDSIQSNSSQNKILIVYFSRTGENYNVGQISIGNTAKMAGFIKDYSGGDIFEIVPSTPYPNSYEKTKELAQQEIANNSRPAIKNKLENLDQYSIIFIGSPIWYGFPPMIMRTFYETYKDKLQNKTLIPFGTHEGSGISSCSSIMKEYFPKANFLESFGVVGNKVNESRETVEEWLHRIGLQKQMTNRK